jgi:hypothetical protein
VNVFAQAVRPALWGLTIGELVMWLIVVAAVLTVGWIIMTKAFGIQPPPWFVHILWVLVAAFVGVVAIKLLLSM